LNEEDDNNSPKIEAKIDSGIEDTPHFNAED
jgi:hypothetical protein